MSRYKFDSNPGTLAKFISRKIRVWLVDLPKLGCKRRVFSAPRQLMSVVEVREVILNDMKKIRPEISELTFYFLLDWALWLYDSAWPRGPGLGRVWVKRCLRFLRGYFSVVRRALQRNKPEPIWPAERGNMEHFLPQSDIRTEDHKITETAGCQLSLSKSVKNFADVMLMSRDISIKYPG